MPTTSSPWASPSSPAGRRLLQTEPVTADDIPVLDDALLALGATLVAASARAAVAPARPAPLRRRGLRRGTRRVLAAVAALAIVGGLTTSAGLDHPAPAMPAATSATTPLALGRTMGSALAHEVAAPVPPGQVVVALVEPARTLTARPAAAPTPLGRRAGALAAVLLDDPAA